MYPLYSKIGKSTEFVLIEVANMLSKYLQQNNVVNIN